VAWIARIAWLIIVGLAIVATWVAATHWTTPQDEGFPGPVSLMLAVVAVTYGTSGLLILRRRPSHTIGILLLVAGLALVAVPVAFGIASDLWERRDPAAAWAYILATLSFWPAQLIAGPAVAMFYPDGHLPGRRWKWPLRVLVAITVFAVVVGLFARSTVVDGGPLNPLSAARVVPAWLFALADICGLIGLLGLIVVGVLAILVRFGRARAEERAQLKWFTFAVICWAVILAASFLIQVGDLFPIAIASLMLVPVAIVIAITRYRLYEIDTLINRTVVYLVLIGIVGGLYAALIVLFQRLFVIATGDTSDAAAVISALILAALFGPIRKLVEAFVDRRFKQAPTPVVAVAVPTSVPTPAPTPSWEEAAFESAVERVVRRVLREERPPQ
jgi:hypothetical protein